MASFADVCNGKGVDEFLEKPLQKPALFKALQKHGYVRKQSKKDNQSSKE